MDTAPLDTAPPIIEAHGLAKSFGSRTAVRDVGLTVPAGCAFGFLGHNGAGKTTVIRMLTGLTRPSAGTIRIAGRSLADHREQVLAQVGAIIEEPRFHLHLTGRENLQVIAAARGPQARQRIEPALARAGLADRGDERVHSYSQGMRQRLGIARCLLADPRLVILDEPMNGLDPGGILELRELIAGLVAEGRTVFLSSHLLDEIEKTCHAAAVIDRGRIIAQGAIKDLIGDTHTEYELTCDRPQVALGILAAHPALAQASQIPGGLRITLADPRAAGAVSALLVRAGITVLSFAPVRASLADRFLGLTSRVGENA
ncbi:MAG TPA: ABC transporter ATP-binding protein [Streptosporangiaceae bacterium]|nr:ABC transporter ATP-binding protein [Streptosporangiaceae bacterium]